MRDYQKSSTLRDTQGRFKKKKKERGRLTFGDWLLAVFLAFLLTKAYGLLLVLIQ